MSDLQKITKDLSTEVDTLNKAQSRISSDRENGKDVHEMLLNHLARANEEETRSQIAKNFVTAFFAVVFLVFTLSIVFNIQSLTYKWGVIIEIQDVVLIIGAITGSLGFVLGYYFKG